MRYVGGCVAVLDTIAYVMKGGNVLLGRSGALAEVEWVEQDKFYYMLEDKKNIIFKFNY